MRTLIKFFGKLFKGIYKLIDRVIVTPISKYTYRITKKFNKRTGGIDKLLNRPNFLLYLSLIIAVAVFLLVDNKVVTLVEEKAEVISNIPITVKSDEKYIVEGIPETVDVILTGRKSDIYLAKQLGEHEVVLDLTDYTASSVPQQVKLTYTKAIDSISYTIDPSYVRVTIKKKESRNFDVSYDLLNISKLDSKLSVKNVELSKTSVTIWGSKDSLDKISTVKALIDVGSSNIKDSGTHTIDNVLVAAYDSTGNIMDNVYIVPNTLSATLTLDSNQIDVPLTILTTGKLVPGKAISSILINNNAKANIKLYGDKELLNSIMSVPVTIDVSGQGNTSSKTYNVGITKPAGVRSMSMDKATVTLTFGEEKQRTIEISNIKFRNIGSNLTANRLSDTNISVQVIGVESVINDVNPKDISAYVDLAGYTTGDYNIDVQIENTDPRLNFVVNDKVGIRISNAE